VLAVIKRGVFAELSKDVALDVEAIHYVLRMEEPSERRELLEITINDLPSMDVRGFRKVGRNIVEHVAARTADVDPSLRAKVAEFGELLEELLTDARVDLLSREADDWAAEKVADREAVVRASRSKRALPAYDPAGELSAASLRGGNGLAEPLEPIDPGVVDLSEFYRMERAEAIEDGLLDPDESDGWDASWETPSSNRELQGVEEAQLAERSSSSSSASSSDSSSDSSSSSSSSGSATGYDASGRSKRVEVPWGSEVVPGMLDGQRFRGGPYENGSYQKPGSPLPPGFNNDPDSDELEW
jgi:hypothetical protein